MFHRRSARPRVVRRLVLGRLGLAATVTGLAAALTVQVPAARAASVAAASPTCRTAQGFVAGATGKLYRVSDPDVASSNASLAVGDRVGGGWTSAQFAWMGAGGDGVLYGLTWAGQIKWFKYDDTAARWDAASGRVVGVGFTPGRGIVNIGLGVEGRFYVVRPTGKLVEFHHTGWQNGSATWEEAQGELVGSGWKPDDVIVPVGDGSVYLQRDARLFWYRHSDPTAGPLSWTQSQVGGGGWVMTSIVSAGGGVLYATTPSGAVKRYQHLDPIGGAAQWTANLGVAAGPSVEATSLGLVIDPGTCSLP